jgi:hypothetical protein
MARPSLPVRFIQPHPIQTAAGIRFEIAHHALRWNLRFHYCMANWLQGSRPVLFDANNVLTAAQREAARLLECPIGSIGRGL